MRNIISALASSALVCACGSSSAKGPGAAALAKTFEYDAAQAPTADEAAAAADAQSAFSPNPSDAAAAVVALVQKLAADSGGPGLTLPAPVKRLHAFLSASCANASGNTVTFTNCSATEGSVTVTVNGTLTASASGASWDITADVQGARIAATYAIATHDVGNFTATPDRISGEAGSDISGTVSLDGKTVSRFALATSVTLDLGYQLTPKACATSGTVEGKLVWTQRPAGVTVADKGVKIAWTGCNSFRVSHSR